MPADPRPPCDVVDCPRPGAGSYLHPHDARAVQFAVCDVHLSQLRAGHRPTVVAARLDLASLDGGLKLLLPLATGDH